MSQPGARGDSTSFLAARRDGREPCRDFSLPLFDTTLSLDFFVLRGMESALKQTYSPYSDDSPILCYQSP